MSAIAADVLPPELRRRSLGALVRDTLVAERDRWALWLPVGFGIGIAGYFRLTQEPAWWLGPAAVAVLLGLAVVLRRWTLVHVALIGLLMAALGFAVAEWRTARVAAPVLEARLGPGPVEGRVRSVDKTAQGHRVVLDRVQVPGLTADLTP